MPRLHCSINGIVSACIFLYLSLLLTTDQGYIAGLVGVFVLSLWALSQAKTIPLAPLDYMLLLGLLGAGGSQLAMLMYNGAVWSEFDIPLRYLAAVPVVLLCLHYPPSFLGIFAGVWVGAVATAMMAAVELYTSPLRASGFTGGIQFGNLGLLLGVVALSIALFGLEVRQKTGFVLMAVVAAMAGVFISLASGSRGGWVAVPLVLSVFYAAYVKREKALRITLFLVLGTALFLAAVSQVSRVKTRIDLVQTDLSEFHRGNENTSIGLRLGLWQAELQLIARQPLTGWNKPQHTLALQDMVAQGKLGKQASELANSHNTFLEIWIYTGIIGLAGVLFLLGVAAYGFSRHIRSANPYTKFAAVSGLNLVLSYCVFSQTQIMLGRNNTLIFFLLMLCMFWGMMRHSACTALKPVEPNG